MAALMNFMKEVMPHIRLPLERMRLLCCVLSYCSLDLLFPYPYPCPCLGWRRPKTSFRLGCVLLDFCFFLRLFTVDFV